MDNPPTTPQQAYQRSMGRMFDAARAAKAAQEITPISRDVIKLIAEDIAKEVASHIETMYPDAVTATSSNMLRSVRGCVFNEIMAALGEIDEEAILRRLETRKQFRRQQRAAYRQIRDQPITEDVLRDA